MKASDYDDGGTFDRFVKEAEEAANGDKELKEKLLGERIIRDIEEYVRAKARHAAAQTPHVLHFHVPKRTRTGICSGSGGGSSQDKKRWFEQMMMIETTNDIDNNNNNIVQEEPAAEEKMKKSNNNNNNNNKRRKIIKKANNINNNARVIPEIPERFKNKIEEMGGSRIMLVIQKEITNCDTTARHNRLAIPPQQIINKFLEPNEYERVVERKEPMKNVKLIEPCLSRVTELTLKRWDMQGNFTLNLIKTWHTEVSTNGSNRLHTGAPVQLYSFRRVENDNELCFALVNLDLEA